MPAKGRGLIKLLISGEVVLIDKEDLDVLMTVSSQTVREDCRAKYVQCIITRGTTTRLHNLIMKKHFGETPKGMVIDHIDRNGLNNCKSNLRFITLSNSMLNTRKRLRPTTSKYKGVYFHKISNKWASSFKNKHLGLFETEELAFKAYKKASKDYEEFILYDDRSVK